MTRVFVWILFALSATSIVVTIAYWQWQMSGVNWVGSMASLLGLALTLYVARSVWIIEQSYLQQALLPKYESKLKASLKNLDQALAAR